MRVSLWLCGWMVLGGCPRSSVPGTPDATDTDRPAETDTDGVDTDGVDPDGPDLRARKSLVLALDGVRPDALAHARTPWFDALIAGTWQGGYRGAATGVAQNLYDAATVSGPNHAAIMTGTTSSQHGVTGNGDVGGGDFDTYRHYLRLIEDDDPARNTASLFTWGTDALITSGADYVKPADDAGNVARLVAMLGGTHSDVDGLYGTRWVAGTDPDALFLFLDDGDHAGHAHGFELGVPEYVAELEEIDGQLGAMLTALAGRPSFADEAWQVVITSDHGGQGTGHGGSGALEHTIPFIVASPYVLQGVLREVTRNVDVVPTVLQHLGVALPAHLAGEARGGAVQPASPALASSLVRHHRFDGDLEDASTFGVHAVIGEHADVAPILIAEGRFGGCLRIEDGDVSSYVTLPELEVGDGDFSVTLWFRSHGDQSGDPVIVGNKDWASGLNPGWVLLADEGDDNSFGSNYASSAGGRLDLEDIAYADTDWWFLAAVRSDGLVTLYAGEAAGGLRAVALEASALGSVGSALPVNVGQDGTGLYPHNLAADIDDLAVWARALGRAEVEALYAGGAGVAVNP